jgi:hypothetical protein
MWIADEWVVCEDYPSYMINRKGEVKSLLTGKILKAAKHKSGYMLLGLRKNGESKTVKVHRLLAKAFIPNPENKPFIDHINGVRDDNRLENLRWCTNQENQSFELARLNNSRALTGRKQSKEAVAKRAKTLQQSIGKRIEQYTLDGQYIKTFNSANEIQRELGIWSAGVLKCCNGKFTSSKGFIWKYAPEVTFENSPQEVELVIKK